MEFFFWYSHLMQFTRGGNSVLYFGLFSYVTIKSCMSIKAVRQR